MILNILTILLLVFLAKRNKLSYWQLINYQKGKTNWKQVVGVTLLILVVGMSGTYLAGFLCYRNVMYVPPVLLTPVPKVIAVINLLLLPVTTVLAEDGLYLGCGVNQIQNKYAAVYALCLLVLLPQTQSVARYDRSFFANLPAVIQVAMVSFMAGAQ